MKKILSVFLAFVLLSVSLTAVAENGEYFENNGNAEDTFVDVTIKSEIYNVADGIVSGIPLNTMSGIAGVNFKYREGVVMEKDGQELAPTDTISTGTVIKQYDGSVLSETAVASVSGDVNGDGIISVADIVSIAGHITDSKLSGIFGFATDVDNSGSTTVTDIVKARKIIMNGFEVNDDAIYTEKTYNTLEYKDFYKLLGRYEETDNGITMDWSASTIEFNAFCEGDVYLEIESLIRAYTVYFVPIIDGKRSYEFNDMVKVNQVTGNTIKIAENLERGYHNIKLVRDTEVMSSFVDVNAIILNGTLVKRPKEKDLMIEVIGDSISCGLAGRNWTYNNQPPHYYGQASESYGYLTAQNLDADVRLVTSSGKSTLTYQGLISMPKEVYKYQHVWKSNVYQEAVKPYNHSNQRDADVIFLALGQNDPRTTANIEPLKNGLKEFAAYLRALHKADTKIVFVYGMMNNDDAFNDAIFPVVANDLGGADAGFYSIKMPACKTLNYGIADGEARFDTTGHPTVEEHSHYATLLTEFMKNEVLK